MPSAARGSSYNCRSSRLRSACRRVALRAAAADRGRPFERGDGVRRTVDAAGMVLLGECDLLGGEILRAADRRPRRRGMAAAKELPVLRGVAARAVRGGEALGHHEAAMIELHLIVCRAMAVEAGDAGRGVLRHLVLMHDGRRLARMALRAFAAGADVRRRRLLHFDARTAAVEDEGGYDDRRGDDDGDEHSGEGTHDGAILPACDSFAQ